MVVLKNEHNSKFDFYLDIHSFGRKNMDDPTIISDSSFGKRLGKITKHGAFMLSYAGKDMPIVGKITIGR